MPGFTADATMDRSGRYAIAAHHDPSDPRHITPAGWKCGVDCVCDPGQYCTETLLGCSCKGMAVTERAGNVMLRG